jgi:hypothetical protein
MMLPHFMRFVILVSVLHVVSYVQNFWIHLVEFTTPAPKNCKVFCLQLMYLEFGSGPLVSHPHINFLMPR